MGLAHRRALCSLSSCFCAWISRGVSSSPKEHRCSQVYFRKETAVPHTSSFFTTSIIFGQAAKKTGESFPHTSAIASSRTLPPPGYRSINSSIVVVVRFGSNRQPVSGRIVPWLRLFLFSPLAAPGHSQRQMTSRNIARCWIPQIERP
ncbi:hypothetical protein F5884DRAFT_288892 [Xylogone sp. PMI_703]|nr:hypothetical protein F5884DRAFT_288892 [Xylogone sp. PMI_703]